MDRGGDVPAHGCRRRGLLHPGHGSLGAHRLAEIQRRVSGCILPATVVAGRFAVRRDIFAVCIALGAVTANKIFAGPGTVKLGQMGTLGQCMQRR